MHGERHSMGCAHGVEPLCRLLSLRCADEYRQRAHRRLRLRYQCFDQCLADCAKSGSRRDAASGPASRRTSGWSGEGLGEGTYGDHVDLDHNRAVPPHAGIERVRERLDIGNLHVRHVDRLA